VIWFYDLFYQVYSPDTPKRVKKHGEKYPVIATLILLLTDVIHVGDLLADSVTSSVFLLGFGFDFFEFDPFWKLVHTHETIIEELFIIFAGVFKFRETFSFFLVTLDVKLFVEVKFILGV
jgi:hypothetical protein